MRHKNSVFWVSPALSLNEAFKPNIFENIGFQMLKSSSSYAKKNLNYVINMSQFALIF